ncbi:glycosyltransferase family 4 protein [Onishia taeanensis]
MKFAIIGVVPESIYNFRGDLIRRILASGHEVLVITGPCTDVQRVKIHSMGVLHDEFFVKRTSSNVFHDVLTFLTLLKILHREKPDKTLCYTIKPVIWGGLASAIVRSDFYALVTGSGYALNNNSPKGRFTAYIVKFLYSKALFFSRKVFFQNPDDRELFVSMSLVDPVKTVVVNGSGVNVDYYDVASFPSGDMTFLCISRLLGDKGLREFYSASKQIKEKWPGCRFLLLGGIDTSPDAISEHEVMAWDSEGALQYLGTRDDVREVIKNSHVFILPSYHEGTPRSVLEAMSMGRPVITTDTPGCRETVIDGSNGFLVSAKDADDLAAKIMRFIENPDLVYIMGAASRELAVKKYDVEKVNDVMMKEMRLGVSHHLHGVSRTLPEV